MDSGEINKILGGVIGALLVFLLLGFFSELIYFGAGGHEEEDRTLAFAVEVEETGGGGEEEVVDFGALLASADASSGASVFNKCRACHSLEDGANAVGPHLYDVVGRDIASVEGFAYSDALADKEGEWGLVNLFEFIHNPSGWAPGTKMGFAGLPDDQDKVDLIVYLNEESGSPVELVAPEMPETAEAEGGDAAEGAEGEAAAEGAGDARAGLIAAADPDAGANVFRKCQACHRLEEGQNLVGPHLYGAVGRDIASVEGFQYSEALASKEGAWDFDRLFEFLHDPQGWAPGTMMGFAGLEDDQDKANVIAYMNQQSDTPVDLGGDAAAEGAAEGEEAAAEGQEAAAGAAEGGEPSAEAEEGEEAAAEVEEGEEAAAEAQSAGDGEDGAVAAAAGDAPEEELLETAEGAGREATAERDGEDRGIPGETSDVKEVELEDEEEAEAKIEAAAEGGDDDAELYSEQQSRVGEADATAEADAADTSGGEAATESTDEAAAGDGEGAAAEGEAAAAEEPGSAAPAEPEEVVDEEVETAAEVETNPTSGLTEILDEERVDPLPEAEEAADAGAEEAEGGDAGAGDELAALLASADPAAGEQVFRQCSACHRLQEGQNMIGPHLYGVVGREIASVESYSYSDALASKEGSWDPAALDAFITDPAGWAPGNKMGFVGLDDPQDRANLIAYLNQESDAPMEFGALPAPGRQAALGADGVRLAGLGFAGLSETATQSAAEATAGRGEAADDRADAAAEIAEGAGELAAEAAEQAADVAERAAEIAEEAAARAGAAAGRAEEASAASIAAARAAEEAEAVAATAEQAAPTADVPATVPQAAERVAAAADALTAVMVEFADAARARPAADATE